MFGAIGAGIGTIPTRCRHHRTADRDRRAGLRTDADGSMRDELVSRMGAAWLQAVAAPGSTVIVSGGAPHAGITVGRRHAELVGGRGIPASRIVVEDRSGSTVQNALNSARIARSRGLGNAVLVSSADHVRRARGGLHHGGSAGRGGHDAAGRLAAAAHPTAASLPAGHLSRRHPDSRDPGASLRRRERQPAARPSRSPWAGGSSPRGVRAGRRRRRAGGSVPARRNGRHMPRRPRRRRRRSRGSRPPRHPGAARGRAHAVRRPVSRERTPSPVPCTRGGRVPRRGARRGIGLDHRSVDTVGDVEGAQQSDAPHRDVRDEVGRDAQGDHQAGPVPDPVVGHATDETRPRVPVSDAAGRTRSAPATGLSGRPGRGVPSRNGRTDRASRTARRCRPGHTPRAAETMSESVAPSVTVPPPPARRQRSTAGRIWSARPRGRLPGCARPRR